MLKENKRGNPVTLDNTGSAAGERNRAESVEDLAAQEEARAKTQQIMEEVDNESRLCSYQGIVKVLITGLSLIWVVFQLYYNTIGTMEAITFRAWHALFLLTFCFLLYPGYKSQNRKRTMPTILDLILLAASACTFLYFIFNYSRISLNGGFVTKTETIIGLIAIILVFLAAKRAAGGLMWLAIIFLAYTIVGKYIGGSLGHAGFSLKRLVGHLFWGSQGLFGTGIGVSATYIFVFVLFGAFLSQSGFTNFINNISMALVGRSVGGAAKVAIIGNALMGMINGSATAIVATTGSIAIPMMKKAGYTKEYSGAVVAAAATGGQFCPPVMGAVAFLMAEFLGVSYSVVLLAAIIPAALYYFGMLMAVHFQAKRSGLSGISKDNLPAAMEVLKKDGHLAAPLISLLGFMIAGYTPLFACVVSIFVTIAFSWLRKETRMGWSKIVAACEEGVRGAISVGVCCLIIGIVVGVTSLTGLGLKFGFLMLKVVGPGELLKCAVMVAIMSTILGMGVPGIAAYVIVTAVAVPVMVKVGCPLLPAHLFCLFYASLSNITPPVAISAYVASGIAGSDQNKTGWLAVRVGLSGFLLPFFFLINPVLLIGCAPKGTGTLAVISAIGGAAIGILLLSAGTEGWLIGKSRGIERAMCIGAALCLIDTRIITDVAGIGLAVFVIAVQIIRRRKGSGDTPAVSGS
ncbi:TRAP transporter fused permease subunit [Clostridium sp. MCC353]|uniref:TRAP transporter permease n=1 Tax=Clostridium sp. MCC353 TaxID=2592646 RepID=UPI001C0146D8